MQTSEDFAPFRAAFIVELTLLMNKKNVIFLLFICNDKYSDNNSGAFSDSFFSVRSLGKGLERYDRYAMLHILLPREEWWWQEQSAWDLQFREFTKHQFIDGLNAAASLFDIFPYIIYIIKEIAKSIQQKVGLAGILDGIGIGHNADTVVLDVHIDVGIGHQRVAVEMDGKKI